MASPQPQRVLYSYHGLSPVKVFVSKTYCARGVLRSSNQEQGKPAKAPGAKAPKHQCALNKPLLSWPENPGPKLTGRGDDSRVNLIGHTSKCSSTAPRGWLPVVARLALCPVWTANRTSAAEREPFVSYPRAAHPPF